MDYVPLCFEKLGISLNSTLEEIKLAYRSSLIEHYADLIDDDKWEKAIDEINLKYCCYKYICGRYKSLQRLTTYSIDEALDYLSGYVKGYVTSILGKSGVDIGDVEIH